MDMELIQRPFGIYEKAIKPQEWEKMFADASRGTRIMKSAWMRAMRVWRACTGMTNNTKR